MTGFEAITAQNGWAMAITGALIVMVGLALLATIISQLHRVIALFESKPAEETTQASEKPAATLPPIDLMSDLPAAAQFYQAVTAELGESFELATAFEVLKRERIPHPHLTLKTLREKGYLIPLGEGRFTWKKTG